MAAADLQAIRAGIRTVLQTLPGMSKAQVYLYEPSSAAGGCAALVGTPEPFSLVSSSYGKGLLELTIPVTLVAGDITERTAWERLDGWVLSASGVWQAFLANQTLGGLVDQCIASEVRVIGEREFGGADRLVAEVAVRVLVRRDA